MAEFQEVMRQLNRMCSYYPNCKDSGCPLFGECGNIGSHSSNAKQSMRIEERVMAWAAEHPEPVYPTWAEYLVGIGVIPHEIRLETADALMDTHLLKPIPADIAKKLGIEPK